MVGFPGPIKKLSSPLGSMLKKAGFDHHMASKFLVKLVLGHCLDLEFYSGMLAVVAVLPVARVGTNSVLGKHWRSSQSVFAIS